MSSDDAAAPAPVPDPQTLKPGSSTQRGGSEQQPPLKCPRCDSPNTKFCYYNNYSLKQPRHFCRTCRRYWTEGGSLRNVPIGGGSRKPRTTNLINKQLLKLKTSSSGSDHHLYFQSRVQWPSAPLAGVSSADHIHMTRRVSLSSIESLSSINQEMHWKLQQQRLVSLLYDDHDDRHHLHHHHQPYNDKKPLAAVGSTEWFFDQTTSYVLNNNSTSIEMSASSNITEVEDAAASGWNYLHHQFTGLH